MSVTPSITSAEQAKYSVPTAAAVIQPLVCPQSPSVTQGPAGPRLCESRREKHEQPQQCPQISCVPCREQGRAQDTAWGSQHTCFKTPPHLTCEVPWRKTSGAMLCTAWQLPNILITNNSKGFFFDRPSQLAGSKFPEQAQNPQSLHYKCGVLNHCITREVPINTFLIPIYTHDIFTL